MGSKKLDRASETGGESVRETFSRSEIIGLPASTPGIPGSLLTSTDTQELAGTRLSGENGIRFATGRRDGKPPEFGPKTAAGLSNLAARPGRRKNDE